MKRGDEKVHAVGLLVGYCYEQDLSWSDIEKVLELYRFLIWSKQNDKRTKTNI